MHNFQAIPHIRGQGSPKLNNNIRIFFANEDGLCMNMKPKLATLNLDLKV